MYDSVLLFAKALHELDRSQDVLMKSLSCEKNDSWSQGQSLMRYMKNVEVDGLTGAISIDAAGRRSHFHLNVVEMTSDGLHVVGTWNTVDGANFTRVWIGMTNKEGDTLFNKTLVVSSILVSCWPVPPDLT